jgi:ABC-type Mn2+/Zn2+ transport system ATPase subunit
MLPLIALAEDAPLIIDQPEDNLDNRLIGNVLVDILAALKEKRQILVATHNPNIVVSGDAEQVIVLEATSDAHGECVLSGSIDKPEVIEAVVEIMEGGKEAFLARRRRYGF